MQRPIASQGSPLYTNVLFAGPNAADADKAALEQARAMEAAGADRNEIRASTGWWNDRGQWSFESSPAEPPQFRRPDLNKLTKAVPLSSVSNDPAFSQSYPSLNDTPVINGAGALLGRDNAAAYLPAAGRPSPYIAVDQNEMWSPRANYFVQHEKQHAVDDYEGSLLPSMSQDRALPWEGQRSEQRAVNGAYRDIYMTPEQRQTIAPWDSEMNALRTMHPQTMAGSIFARRMQDTAPQNALAPYSIP